MPLLLTSPVLPPGGMIAKEYTCDGSDISPPLAWSGAPPKTASFVLVVEDPDAPGGTFHHWAAYDIPATATSLAAGYRAGAPAPFALARNDFGKIGYSGPCPPPGSRHRYVFTLLALSRPNLALPPSADAQAVIGAALPYVVGRATLTASYQR
ncbi:MAG TPA: YbhB/YbcL family Raf kinase inhibitor-like protein [Stellaceae bacterium]|nr:YbhB/YbcL family Raf kinase inhibitor-like protein [Stellaceae bacterium]